MTDRERLLDELRPVAFAIAYQMLGSLSEAEDVMQEALLRVHQALDGGEEIASPHAFVATVTTQLAINELRSARARRECYFGEWLPEPIVTGGHDDPARHAETADSLSLAMLMLLESLSPEQRDESPDGSNPTDSRNLANRSSVETVTRNRATFCAPRTGRRGASAIPP